MLGDLVYNPKASPEMIEVVPIFHTCIKAHWTLFEHEKAHVALVRTNVVHLLLCGLANISGTCFGSIFLSDTWVWFSEM